MELQSLEAPRQAARAARGRLAVGLARGPRDIEQAQRLRYEIFAGELGARLDASSMARRVDRDAFDAYCQHLIARDLETGEVVGTYRILPPDAARAAGGYYSEQEFDLGRLAGLRQGLVEVGRSCVHRDYRSGPAILLLWAGLLDYMKDQGLAHLFGCASISMADGGDAAAALWRRLEARHLAPAEQRVFAHQRLPVERLCPDSWVHPVLPPLIKGYLNIGAKVCGEPAWDPGFNTADFPVMLSISQINQRYARHFKTNVI